MFRYHGDGPSLYPFRSTMRKRIARIFLRRVWQEVNGSLPAWSSGMSSHPFAPFRMRSAHGLREVSDRCRGIRRTRRGRSFAYFDGTGRLVKSAVDVRRIKSLAIPPAWTDVWI